MAKAILHRIRALVFMAGWLVLPLAAQQPRLTLQQAVAAALEHNPAQKLAAADMAASEAGFQLSKSPAIAADSILREPARGNDPVYAFGTKLRQQGSRLPTSA